MLCKVSNKNRIKYQILMFKHFRFSTLNKPEFPISRSCLRFRTITEKFQAKPTRIRQQDYGILLCTLNTICGSAEVC